MGLLTGRAALIAGVGTGLGREAALALAREGAAMALLARGDRVVGTVAEEVRGCGVPCITVKADITSASDCRRAAAETVRELGKIDVLVNIAFRDDSPNRKSLMESDEDLSDWRRIFEVNVYGTLLITKAVLPTMIAARSGTVVMVNSMTANRVLAKAGSYAASKAALLKASQCLALELAPDGIRVNSLHPGYIWNEFVQGNAQVRAARNNRSVEAERDEILKGIPLGRIPEAKEYAGSILYLASDLSGSMTGASVHVNGGQYIA